MRVIPRIEKKWTITCLGAVYVETTLIVFEMRSQMRRTFNIYHRGVPCNPLWLTLEVVPLGWNGWWPILLVLKTEEKRYVL